jgi:hypothetical protein
MHPWLRQRGLCRGHHRFSGFKREHAMARELIDAASADRLLRDLEATASATLRGVVADAKDHIWLLERMPTADVNADTEFQRQLCRHAGMRGKLRMRRDDLFAILDDFRRSPVRTYPDLLMKISELTGQVEKSVASEILALLEPDQPTIDREVRELLPRYGFYPLPESPLFDECVAYHRELREAMMLVVALPAFQRLEARFDQAVGPGSALLSPLRKFNLQLSGSYRTVALMPNMDSVRKSPARPLRVEDTPVRAAVPPVSTRPGVRLHFCR